MEDLDFSHSFIGGKFPHLSKYQNGGRGVKLMTGKI